jgi:prepilin-type N-terminal cleavage/methylation domain-containing protein
MTRPIQNPAQRRGADCCPKLAAFTLTELLVVIAIIGILVAIGVPAARNFNRGNLVASASRQLLDDLAAARQRALASRSPVYVVFAPPSITAVNPASLTPNDRYIFTNLLEAQFAAYAIYSPRTVGDQPGQATYRYLTPWKTLPQGAFIPPAKYFSGITASIPYLTTPAVMQAFPVSSSLVVPFPSAQSSLGMKLPFIGFDHEGRLITGKEEIIPIAEGNVDPAKDASGRLILSPATVAERPVGNWTNQPNVVRVDWLTGRAHVEKREIQ